VFLLGGNATLTFVSEKTGARYTYRVRTPEDQSPSGTAHFVSVLFGPDNEGDYAFMGTIFGGAKYRHGRRSKIAEGDVRERAFAYALGHLLDRRMPPRTEIWHEGRCCRCGRKLTVPGSIERGIGPDCAAMMGEAA
jgi:hypothetical protein